MSTKKTTKTTSVEQPTIYQRLHNIQCEVEKMAKTGRNTQQGYHYLTESDISETFKALLQKHGVFFTYSSFITDVRPSPSAKQLVTDVMVKYEFVDIVTGQKIEGQASGQGADATDKGVYKAITGAVKYIFMKTFLIPTGDDPERDTPARSVRKTPARSYSDLVPDTPPFGEGAEEED